MRCLAARHLLRAGRREGHLELAHWCAGRVRRKGQDRSAGRARRAGGNSWCRHLRRRHPHSAVTSGVNVLVSLAHIGVTERRQLRRSPRSAHGSVMLKRSGRRADRRVRARSSTAVDDAAPQDGWLGSQATRRSSRQKTLFSTIRTLAKLTRFWGANGGRRRATPSDT